LGSAVTDPISASTTVPPVSSASPTAKDISAVIRGDFDFVRALGWASPFCIVVMVVANWFENRTC
jgi:hypothetical protein